MAWKLRVEYEAAIYHPPSHVAMVDTSAFA